MILRNSLLAIFIVLPLMSLNDGGDYTVQKMRSENDELKKEIKTIDYKIKVVDNQIRYKDSIDALNYQSKVLNLSK